METGNFDLIFRFYRIKELNIGLFLLVILTRPTYMALGYIVSLIFGD